MADESQLCPRCEKLLETILYLSKHGWNIHEAPPVRRTDLPLEATRHNYRGTLRIVPLSADLCDALEKLRAQDEIDRAAERKSLRFSRD
jgi:hypothetical protein